MARQASAEKAIAMAAYTIRHVNHSLRLMLAATPKPTVRK